MIARRIPAPAIVFALAFAPAVSFAQTSPTQSAVYTLAHGQVQLKVSAEEHATSSAARIAVAPGDFEKANVYRGQLLLETGAVQTALLDIPADATTITITARSRPAGDIFPRLGMALITEDNNRHRIHEGYWQSISMQTAEFPVNEWVRGKKARLAIEILNPGRVEEQRTWYLQAVQIP